MKSLILAFLLVTALSPQTQKPTAKISPQLKGLRSEYIRATTDYKESLLKLKGFYETDVKRSEERVEVAKRLFAEGLVPNSQIEENTRQVQNARERLDELNQAITRADREITDVSDDAKFIAQYSNAVVQRKKERKGPCVKWTLTTYYRKTSRSIEGGYKFVCSK